MKSTEAELAELQARVARLESTVEHLSRAGAPAVPAAPPAPAAGGELPPILSAATVPPKPAPGPTPRVKQASRETPATVWIAGAGAVIFLIGVIYGLTVSIQRGWISPGVRVLAGIGTGAALGVAAARLILGSGRFLGVALLMAATGTWTFAFYYGAHEAHLFHLAVGFGGTAVATILAGALGARARSDGALAVALGTGLAAPLAFSDGSGRLPVLLSYLLLLTVAPIAINYLTGTGGQWRWARIIGVGGTWFVALLAASGARLVETPELSLLLSAVLGLAVLVLAWLPRHPEQPWLPGAATVTSQIGLAIFWWEIWHRAGFEQENFSVVLAALAAGSFALVVPARKRSGGGRHDLPLFLLTMGFALVAVAVRFDWRWVVVAWGMFAALVAWAAHSATAAGREESSPLLITAALAATAATIAWSGLVWDQGVGDMIFLNRVFLGGLLAAVAWCLQVLTPGPLRPVAFVALQIVAVNVLALELTRAVPAVRIDGLSLAVGALLATLVYAVAGAGQWLWGMTQRLASGSAKALRLAGYGWLAFAASKLLLHDLAGTDLLFRAAAALGVGAIFIGAALWANHARTRSTAQ